MSREKEPKPDKKINLRFRQLVGRLISNSDLFQTTPLRATLSGEYTELEKKEMKEERSKIIEAIEKNQVSSYMPKNASERMLDAVNCLIAIYDELKKENPDEDFIKETTERLKEYL